MRAALSTTKAADARCSGCACPSRARACASVPCERAGGVAAADDVAVRSYKAVSSGIKVTAWPVTFAVLMVFKGRACLRPLLLRPTVFFAVCCPPPCHVTLALYSQSNIFLHLCARGPGDHVTLLREEVMSADEHQRWLATRPGLCSSPLRYVRPRLRAAYRPYTAAPSYFVCVRERRVGGGYTRRARAVSRCLFAFRCFECWLSGPVAVHVSRNLFMRLGMCVWARGCRTNEMVGARVQGATGTGGCQSKGQRGRAAKVRAAGACCCGVVVALRSSVSAAVRRCPSRRHARRHHALRQSWSTTQERDVSCVGNALRARGAWWRRSVARG